MDCGVRLLSHISQGSDMSRVVGGMWACLQCRGWIWEEEAVAVGDEFLGKEHWAGD